MSIGRTRSRRSRAARLPVSRCGLLAAVLALIGQLALGGMVPPDRNASRLVALDTASILCVGRDAPAGQVPHRHHAADLALCPLDIALALPGGLLPDPAALLPARCCEAGGRSRERPPGRGPPAATARVGEPRGPPVTT